LSQIYFQNGFMYGEAPADGQERAKRIIPVAKQYAAHGSAGQRVIALDALLHASPDDAAQAAKDMLGQGASLGQGLHLAAFQVLLLSIPKEDAAKKAVEQLTSSDAALRKLALAYLAVGPTGVQTVQGELYLDVQGGGYQPMAFGGGAAIVVSAPPDLKSETLAPALKDSDLETQAYAGYLLCLTDIATNRQGLQPLLTRWRQQPSDDPWRKLVYRAVASLGDDAQTPLLEEVYRTFRPGDWDVREFYWTIRSMDGPNILKLRKQIRDDVGMERLR